jgi:hypothetical protein
MQATCFHRSNPFSDTPGHDYLPYPLSETHIEENNRRGGLPHPALRDSVGGKHVPAPEVRLVGNLGDGPCGLPALRQRQGITLPIGPLHKVNGDIILRSRAVEHRLLHPHSADIDQSCDKSSSAWGEMCVCVCVCVCVFLDVWMYVYVMYVCSAARGRA